MDMIVKICSSDNKEYELPFSIWKHLKLIENMMKDGIPIQLEKFIPLDIPGVILEKVIVFCEHMTENDGKGCREEEEESEWEMNFLQFKTWEPEVVAQNVYLLVAADYLDIPRLLYLTKTFVKACRLHCETSKNIVEETIRLWGIDASAFDTEEKQYMEKCLQDLKGIEAKHAVEI